MLFAAAVSGLAQQAAWISAKSMNANSYGAWTAFRKDVEVRAVPEKLVARIAVDSKYWLWINGKLAVFEGGLKRGPNPRDTYCDEVDIAPYLQKGANKIAVLVWFFGKDGFSHISSGKSGLFFEAVGESISIVSDATWLARVHPAYSAAKQPMPNYRLSESNVRFDANEDMPGWQTADAAKQYKFAPAQFCGFEGYSPWNKLVPRPIPMWKDSGVKHVEFSERVVGADKIVEARLPYNMQLTPVITLDDRRGRSLVDIQTDHSFAASTINLRAEYITKRDVQTYESFGWLNGEKIILKMPAHIRVVSVAYRETGYNAEMAGEFSCDSMFYTKYWQKAVRTLYVNMRDNYFDCPERERAQWWGDAVMLAGESFYTLSPAAHKLTRKAMRELSDWAREDGVIFSPIPSGSRSSELPGQMLASIGRCGFWNYYMNTGDADTIKHVYPAVKKYLSLWELDETGLTKFRKGDWTWGDWGYNKDTVLIFAGFHALALEAAANMAEVAGFPADAEDFRSRLANLKDGFNKCWNGREYRHPTFDGDTDDRANALAVVAGIAAKDKYPALLKVFKRHSNASPYMEKYVMEALVKMGYPDYALSRAQLRYGNMAENRNYTTLYESWEVGGFGGGSTNHAWSGGALTVVAQYICGVYPLEPGWKTFKIEPEPSLFENISITVPSIAGKVKSAFKVSGGGFEMDISVPKGATAVLFMPEFTNGKKIAINGGSDLSRYANDTAFTSAKTSFKLAAGEYKISAK